MLPSFLEYILYISRLLLTSWVSIPCVAESTIIAVLYWISGYLILNIINDVSVVFILLSLTILGSRSIAAALWWLVDSLSDSDSLVLSLCEPSYLPPVSGSICVSVFLDHFLHNNRYFKAVSGLVSRFVVTIPVLDCSFLIPPCITSVNSLLVISHVPSSFLSTIFTDIIKPPNFSEYPGGMFCLYIFRLLLVWCCDIFGTLHSDEFLLFIISVYFLSSLHFHSLLTSLLICSESTQ